MDKLKIAVLFGGISEEHDISVKSAQEIAGSLDREKYEPVFVGISKTGKWRLCEEPKQGWFDENGIAAIISPDKSVHGLTVFENGSTKNIWIDVVFPMMHGKMGEDGQIQGLLKMSGIPYVGCDIQSSVLGIDKSLTHLVAQHACVLTPDFHIVNKFDEVDEKLIDYPVFVKPARSGSSFGVSKVTKSSELKAALEEAGKYDSKILIEEAIEGTEVGCAVLGNGNDLTVGEADMISISHGFFRIHQEKTPEQGSENSVVIVPAPVPEKVSQRIKDTAKTIYRAMGCCGLARVDMFLKENGEIVLNEVNTMPGCTVYSRYPRMMKAAGHSMTEIIDEVITLALKNTQH